MKMLITLGQHGIFGPRREKTCLRGFSNNTGADQPAHTRSLIIAFVIRLLESIISRLASSEISTFWLVSIAEETGLKLALSEILIQLFTFLLFSFHTSLLTPGTD